MIMLISSDFDSGGGILKWKDASETFNVTQLLSEVIQRKLKNFGFKFIEFWMKLKIFQKN